MNKPEDNEVLIMEVHISRNVQPLRTQKAQRDPYLLPGRTIKTPQVSFERLIDLYSPYSLV